MRNWWPLCCGILLTAVAIHREARRTAAVAEPANAQLTDAKSRFALPIEGGVPYAIGVATGLATLNLEFTDTAEYLLIASSLGDAARTFDLELKSAELDAGPVSNLYAVGRLELRPLPTVRPNPAPAGARPVRHAASVNSESSARRDFFVPVGGRLEVAANYACVHAQRIAEGRQVRVYHDPVQPTHELDDGAIAELIRLLDEEILPKSAELLGLHEDIDQDGKLAVLLTPRLGRLGGNTPLGGFVRGSDFQPGLPAPFSNHCDLMYLNSDLRPTTRLKALLAHEYTHAVCFSRRALAAQGGAWLDEEDWLNEAIAHVAESLHAADWSNRDYRIARFLDAPQAAPLVVPDYYRSGRWRDDGCRGATCLFLHWCVEQSGAGLLGNLVESPTTGVRNVERATGAAFADLFRQWTIALWQSGRAGNHPRRSGGALPRNAAFGLNLRGRLGTANLCGPRPIFWTVDQPPPPVRISGTATAFLVLRAPAYQGIRRIQIQVEPGCELQLTLMATNVSHSIADCR